MIKFLLKLSILFFLFYLLVFVTFFIIRSISFYDYDISENSKTLDIRIPEIYQSEFIAKNNGLYRIDLKLKNPNIESKDEYRIEILDNNQNLVVERIISGFNIGDPGEFRINFPRIENSKNKTYQIIIKKENIIDHNLKLTVYKDDNQIAANSYYRLNFEPKEIFNEVVNHIILYSKTAYIPIILVIILLLFTF